MNHPHRSPPPSFLAAAAILLASLPITSAPAKTPAAAAKKHEKTPAAKANSTVSRDNAVRLQLFLDRENFGPGKIDGSYGGFTKLAWMHWQQAHGIEKPETATFDPKNPQLAAIDPVFTAYTVTADDLANLGPVPPQPQEQAKLKALTYVTLSELLGERFHSGVDFLKKLNAPKNLDTLKEGDTVNVPNVQAPFDLAQVGGWRDIQRAQALARKKEQQKAGAAPAAGGSPAAPANSPPPAPAAPTPSPVALPAAPALSPAAFIHINVKECYLELRDGDKTVAAFPVTPGSKAIPTPVGEWKIDAKALFPEFRWDKEMLEHGRRSKDAHQLPPGPNSPVGIVWVQLNKPGIGLHGTGEPDTIGRSASHGCVRLANWDAFKLYGMVSKGMKVIIE